MRTGELITLYRNQAGMTIDELVEKSGVPKGTLNKIISGDTKAPALDKMKAIARALGKTLNDFARDEESDIEPNEKTPLKPDGPAQEESGRGLISLEVLEQMLVDLGAIRPGEPLSDSDLKFFMGLGTLIEAWSSKRKESGGE